MGKRILILAAALACAIQGVLAAAQGGVAKQRAVGDLVLTASLADCRDSFCLTLDVRNVGPKDIELRPDVITLRMDSAGSRDALVPRRERPGAQDHAIR